MTVIKWCSIIVVVTTAVSIAVTTYIRSRARRSIRFSSY
jgi:hypothetical protein